jgi:hypothetical protein
MLRRAIVYRPMDSNSVFKQSSDCCCIVAARVPLLAVHNRQQSNFLVFSKHVINKGDGRETLLMLQDSGIHSSRVNTFGSIKAPAGSHSETAVLMVGCASHNEIMLPQLQIR